MSNPRTSSTAAAALRVLRILADHPSGIGVSDVAKHLDVGASTAHLLLSTLVEQDFATQNEDKRYVLGFSAFEVGAAVSDTARFGGEVLGPMQGLAELSGEAVSLAVPRHREAVIVQRFEVQHVLRVDIRVGTRMPMTTSASGKIFLSTMTDEEIDRLYPDDDLDPTTPAGIATVAALKKDVLPLVRERRYATTQGEFALGIDGVAAAVVDHRGLTVASLSAAGPSSRFDPERWAQDTIDAADAMSKILARRLA